MILATSSSSCLLLGKILVACVVFLVSDMIEATEAICITERRQREVSQEATWGRWNCGRKLWGVRCQFFTSTLLSLSYSLLFSRDSVDRSLPAKKNPFSPLRRGEGEGEGTKWIGLFRKEAFVGLGLFTLYS